MSKDDEYPPQKIIVVGNEVHAARIATTIRDIADIPHTAVETREEYPDITIYDERLMADIDFPEVIEGGPRSKRKKNEPWRQKKHRKSDLPPGFGS